MLALALKSFRGRYGLIRAGTTFNCAPGYFEALAKNGWVKLAEEPTPPPAPVPEKNRGIPEAPKRGGKSGAATTKGGGKSKSENTVSSAKPSEDPPAAGGPVTSRSLRRDLRSRAKIALGSASGEKSPSSSENPPGE